MSDPVSNAEIEDVLSSIRRLVSEDVRNTVQSLSANAGHAETGSTAAQESRPEDNANPHPAASERLVLTPSLRVADDPAPDESADQSRAEEAPQPQASDIQTQETAQDDVFVALNPLPKAEAEMDQAGDDASDLKDEPELAQDDWPQDDQVHDDLAHDDHPQDTQTDHVTDDAAGNATDNSTDNSTDNTTDDARAEAPWDDPDATLYDAAATYGAEEAVQDQHSEEPQGATSDPDTDHQHGHDGGHDGGHDHGFEQEADQDFFDTPADAATAQDSPDPDQEVAAESWDTTPDTDMDWTQDTPQDEAWHDVEAVEPARDEPETAGASQALSALLAGADQDQLSQADEPEEQVLPQAEPIEWEDADQDQTMAAPEIEPEIEPEHEPDIEAQHQQASSPSEEDDLDLMSEAEETFLDEASLRELVRDIVREELQGALGERITRNVRKLVRREINRAMSIQDLE